MKRDSLYLEQRQKVYPEQRRRTSPKAWLFAIWLAWLGLWLAAVAQAQSTFHAEADYTFGQAMHFHLTAEHPSGIRAVTLFFRAPEFPNAFTAAVPVTSGQRVAVTHPVDLTQVQLAPFTTVTYWWLLTTEAGEDITLPEQTIVYEDDQFDWRQLTRDGVTVHWTGEDAALGQLALDIVAEAWPHLNSLIPLAESKPFDLYLYPSSADLRSALRLTGRDWVGAHAHPELGVILVTAVNARTAASDLRQSIPHELVHFLLYQATGAGYDELPLWFNEGLATFVETTPNPSYEPLLQMAVAGHTTIPFADLCQTFPAAEDSALLAYAQSVSLIHFIEAGYGNHALRELVAAFADGADCYTGVNRVLGLSLDELNRRWLQSLQIHPPLVQFWYDNRLWLLLLLGGFIITTLLVIGGASPGRAW